MDNTIRWCVDEWKRDINHGQYQKVITDTWGVANLFYSEKNQEWINAFKSIIKKIEESSDRKIMPHIKKYMKDFLKVAIKAINGKVSNTELRKQKDTALELLSKAYSS